MNRSILIVICDFLLVSLLAFSNFEPVENTQSKALPPPTPESGNQRDLIRALKLALEDERQGGATLAAELSNTRAAVQTQQNLSAQRESQLQQAQEKLRQSESQARGLDQQRTTLQQQLSVVQTNAQSLRNSLSASRSETKLTQEQLEVLRAKFEQEQAAAAALQQRLALAEQSHSNALAEKQQLNTKLQVTEAEKRLASEQLSTMRSEVQTIRAEKAQMQANTAQLVQNLSEQTEKMGGIGVTVSNLAQVLRESRPMAANAVFNDFTQSRVDARFELLSGGPLGTSVRKDKTARTVLVSDGKQTWALFHITDTPFTLGTTETYWQSLKGVLSRGAIASAISRVSFLAHDPRIVAIPVEAAQAEKLGAKVFKVASDPFKFQDAVLVGTGEGYYGECKFQIDLTTPNYVKMDRSIFRGLFGKFNPSRGDLVMSRTGEVLGIMANDQYCVVLGEIVPSVTIQCGDDLKSQQTGTLFAELHKRWFALPGKLQ